MLISIMSTNADIILTHFTNLQELRLNKHSKSLILYYFERNNYPNLLPFFGQIQFVLSILEYYFLSFCLLVSRITCVMYSLTSSSVKEYDTPPVSNSISSLLAFSSRTALSNNSFST